MGYVDFVNGNSYEEMDKLSKSLFGDNIDDNECSGCVYDIIPTSDEELRKLFDVCPLCRRGMREECKDQYQDLYMKG